MAIAEHELGPDPETMTVKEAARLLGISESHIYKRSLEHGDLAPGVPIIQIGATKRLPRSKVLAWARGDWTPGQPWPPEAVAS